MINVQGPWTYVFVFFGVIALMCLSTVRCMFMAGGKKVISSFIAFAEVMLWLTVTSEVVTNVTEDPIKLLAYCLGGAVGTKIGQAANMRLNSRVVSIEAEGPASAISVAAAALSTMHLHVTVVECTGDQHDERSLLCVDPPRSLCDDVVAVIRNVVPGALITQAAPYSLHGNALLWSHGKE